MENYLAERSRCSSLNLSEDLDEVNIIGELPVWAQPSTQRKVLDHVLKLDFLADDQIAYRLQDLTQYITYGTLANKSFHQYLVLYPKVQLQEILLHLQLWSALVHRSLHPNKLHAIFAQGSQNRAVVLVFFFAF